MIRAAIVGAAVATVACLSAAAENFPLTFKTVPADQISKFPGGYGAYGQLRLAKPAGIKKEPKPVSKHPLYGECREDEDGPRFVFRLDESKGDGKGYDQLIVDLNQNGDLTDDGAAEKVAKQSQSKAESRVREPSWFGPLPAPPGKEFAGGRPIFYAHVYINDLPQLRSGLDLQNVYAGYLRLKPAWYLEAAVEINGTKHKVGVFDGNGNLRLGDLAAPQTYENGSEKNWYFRPGDNFLVDANGSDSFETDPLENESRPFGPILYLGGVPCKTSLDSGCTSLRVEPWTDPLAEVVLEPKGMQVRSLTLAWEHPAGKWQLVSTPVENGKINVPPGKYRLYGCSLLGKSAPADQVMVAAYQRSPKTPFKFEAGKPNKLACGAPLEIKATAEKRTPQSWELPAAASRNPSEDSEYVVRINANLQGADGEIYSTFSKGAKLTDSPPKPVFTVMDSGGKKLANGNLEFG